LNCKTGKKLQKHGKIGVTVNDNGERLNNFMKANNLRSTAQNIRASCETRDHMGGKI